MQEVAPTRSARRTVLRWAFLLATLFLAVHLLLPQLAGLEATSRALARTNVWIILGFVALQAASFSAYAELVRTLLRAGGADVPRSLVQRASIVSASLAKTLPGGSTTALALTMRTLSANGVDASRAATALAASGALSAATLGILLPVAAATAILMGHAGGIALGGAAAALVVLTAVSLVPLAIRDPDALALRVERIVAAVARGPLRRLDPSAAARAVCGGVAMLRALLDDRRKLARAFGWASANWLLDAAVLFGIAATLGSGMPLGAIPLAYVLAQLLTAVPITPGGVGVVETAVTGALVAAGAPGGSATVTVLGWRLLSHWLPILVGLALLPTIAGRRRRVEVG